MEEKDETEKNRAKKNLLEWVVFVVSLLLVIGILVYLGYKSYTYIPSSPDILVEYAPSPTALTPYRYHVTVSNTGDETAEQVSVELVLQADSAIEKAELLLSFVPQKSRREGWVNFSHDPGKADSLIARVISFKKP